MRFVTHTLQGHEGLVRGLFAGRDLAAPASGALFPGIRGVAIMPRQFDDAAGAGAWTEQTAQPGGNAVAVKCGPERWLICAWVE